MKKFKTGDKVRITAPEIMEQLDSRKANNFTVIEISGQGHHLKSNTDRRGWAIAQPHEIQHI